MKRYDGIYRGIVLGVHDEEGRGRVQVAVYGVHYPELTTWEWTASGEQQVVRRAAPSWEHAEVQILPDSSTTESPFECYPWAEVISPSSCLAGLHVTLREGDLVFVVFERGDVRYPLVLGGWISCRGGLRDHPPEADGFESETQGGLRHTLEAPSGALFDASGASAEGVARVAVPGTEFVSEAATGSIDVSVLGMFRVRGGAASFFNEAFFVASKDVILDACDKAPYDIEDHRPLLGLYSTWEADFYAADAIHIGQILRRRFAEIPPSDYERNDFQQSRLTWVAPKLLALGCVRGESGVLEWSTFPESAVDMHSTERVAVQATDSVSVIVRGSESVGMNYGLLGLYSDFSAEIHATQRVWLGQYVDLGEGRVYPVRQSNVVLANGARTVIGGLRADCFQHADWLNGFVSGADASVSPRDYPLKIHADDRVAESVSTPYSEMWASVLIQIRTETEEPSTYEQTCPPITTDDLRGGDVFIWGRRVIVQGTEDVLFYPGVLTVWDSDSAGGRVNVLKFTDWNVDVTINECVAEVSVRSAVTVKITGNATGGGKYFGRVLTGPSTAGEATDLSMPEGRGVPTADNALVLNLVENGSGGHELASGTFHIGLIVGRVVDGAYDGYFIVEIEALAGEDCSEA